MKTQVLFGALFLFTISINAQSLYEAGYFINNDGKKVDCLIKKRPWKDNPATFEWKKNISSKPKEETVDDIKEFSVGREFLFKRFIIKYDPKGDDLGRATKSVDPDLKVETVFLRVLLESKSSLYQYATKGVYRYFYTSKENEVYYPELLVYKVYYKPDTTKKPGKKIIPQENLTYKQQLKNHLLCRTNTPEKVDHTAKSFIRYFKEFNECKGNEITYIIKKKIHQKQFGIIAGADLIRFPEALNPPNLPDVEVTYDDIYALKYGAYIETFIPFSGVDLSFFLEGNYQMIEFKPQDTGTDNNFTIEREIINIALAPRFHLYLNKTFGLFVEGGVNVDLNLKTESESEIEIFGNTKNNTTSFFYGGGLSAGRIKIGYRQYTDRDISKSNFMPEVSSSSVYIALSLLGGNTRR